MLGQRRRRIVLRHPENEMYHRHRFDTRARARFAVVEYIEIFTTGSSCTRRWTTEPRPKPWQNTNSAPQPDRLTHQDLSKIL
jgi:hypothetical protein